MTGFYLAMSYEGGDDGDARELWENAVNKQRRRIMQSRPLALIIPAPETITISDLDQWLDFWAANQDALEMDGHTFESAQDEALDGNLMIGGGASPCFRVEIVAGEE